MNKLDTEVDKMGNIAEETKTMDGVNMKEDTKITEIVDVKDEEKSGVLIFDKPYIWEGKEYTSVDISVIENLRGIDLVDAQQFTGSGISTNVNVEYDLKTIMFLASRATGKPVEFFENLPIKEAIKLKYKAISFL